MSTVCPAVPGGLGTNSPGLFGAKTKQGPCTVGAQAGTTTDPNATAVAPLRSLPRISTPVPPAADPLRGVTPVTTGGPTRSYVNVAKPLIPLVPPALVTVTSTVVPGGPGGLTKLIPLFGPPTLKHGPNTDGPQGDRVVAPKATCGAPVRPLP